jgi:hypothetical protein
MRRTLIVAVVMLGLAGCGRGGNQRSGVLPEADTPPDPPASSAVESSAAASPPVSANSG